MVIELIDPVVAQQTAEQASQMSPEVAEINANGMAKAAAAIGVGLAALAAGYAERGIGSAAVGAMAEDPGMFGRGLLMTVLPETLVIFAIVVIFLVP
ncbi:MAG: V/A-type H+-transporting ATPase subunit K [Methanobacteriota archaeon]|jgi:V/A-type H+-transporting ATPase subunit K